MRQTFRQWGQLMVGAACALLAVALGWTLAVAHGGPHLAGLAWCALLLAVAFAVFLRPAVHLDDDGLRVANILRDTVIPWAAVRGAGTRWSLTVDTTSRSVSAWAISGTASPGRDALARRRLAARVGPPPTTGASAAAIAALIEDRLARRALGAPQRVPATPGGSGGASRAAPSEIRGDLDGGVVVRTAWLPVTLLAVSVLAVALTALL